MIVVRDFAQLKDTELVATIGFFDGVHVGHRFLIGELKQIARSVNRPSAVITFSGHPRAVLQSGYRPQLLSSFDEKTALLAETGIDYCIVLDFTPFLASFSAEMFMRDILFAKIHVSTLLIGYDHRFGRNREEDFEAYVAYGKKYGMRVCKASRYTEGEAAVSSSEIRKMLAASQVEQAARLLGYPYSLTGRVVQGRRVGRTIGFPTANIRVDEPLKILPGIGIYAVWVHLGEQRYKGMLYIGNRPTLHNGDDITLEVHVLDFSGDIYNNEIGVTFIRYIRGDIRFESVEDLALQLEEDRKITALLLQ